MSISATIDLHHRRGQPVNMPWNFGLAPQGAGLLRGSVLCRAPQIGAVWWCDGDRCWVYVIRIIDSTFLLIDI